MARPFFDERLDLAPGYGTSFAEVYEVDNQVTAGSAGRPPSEYARLRHPYPRARYTLDFGGKRSDVTIDQILDLFHRVGGTFGAFRVKHRSDFSTNSYRKEPTSADQILLLDADAPAPHRYQLTRWYGTQGDATATRRRILKPVAGSVVVGIRDAAGADHELAGGYSVDADTGTVTYTDNERSISAITPGAQTEIEVGGSHGYVAGQSVVVSDVGGMTELNGLRAEVASVTSTTITLPIDSTGFSSYDTGGQVNRAPQTELGEHPTAGCYFDLPMRFETDLTDVTYSNWDTLGTTVQLVELLAL